MEEPEHYGSGGGTGCGYRHHASHVTPGGHGGGRVFVNVSEGTLHIASGARISADGGAGTAGSTSSPRGYLVSGGGGGSGGSIRILARELAGSGAVTARGGAGGSKTSAYVSSYWGTVHGRVGGGGGGGRISVLVGRVLSSDVSLVAYGGLPGGSSAQRAAAGTIFSAVAGVRSLHVDNGDGASLTGGRTVLDTSTVADGGLLLSMFIVRSAQVIIEVPVAVSENLTLSDSKLDTRGEITGTAHARVMATEWTAAASIALAALTLEGTSLDMPEAMNFTRAVLSDGSVCRSSSHDVAIYAEELTVDGTSRMDGHASTSVSITAATIALNGKVDAGVVNMECGLSMTVASSAEVRAGTSARLLGGAIAIYGDVSCASELCAVQVLSTSDIELEGTSAVVSAGDIRVDSGGDVAIRAGAKLSASGRGPASLRGAGAGGACRTSYGGGSGGGHGGEGGYGEGAHSSTRGTVYGDMEEPEHYGSGGGTGCGYRHHASHVTPGGHGGGRVFVNVSEGTLHIASGARISADGGAGTAGSTSSPRGYLVSGGGGGSGGSIRILARELAGSGAVTARGGAGGSKTSAYVSSYWGTVHGKAGGGGGGGRVALLSHSQALSLAVDNTGGSSGGSGTGPSVQGSVNLVTLKALSPSLPPSPPPLSPPTPPPSPSPPPHMPPLCPPNLPPPPSSPPKPPASPPSSPPRPPDILFSLVLEATMDEFDKPGAELQVREGIANLTEVPVENIFIESITPGSVIVLLRFADPSSLGETPSLLDELSRLTLGELSDAIAWQVLASRLHSPPLSDDGDGGDIPGGTEPGKGGNMKDDDGADDGADDGDPRLDPTNPFLRVILPVVGTGMLVLMCVVVLLGLRRWFRRLRSAEGEGDGPTNSSSRCDIYIVPVVHVNPSPSPTPDPVPRFLYQQLAAACRDFDNHAIIGRGGFGVVYEGVLLLPGASSERRVAVKKADNPSDTQVARAFEREAQILGRCRHPNVLALLGVCDEALQVGTLGHPRALCLVTELMVRGSLHDCLHTRSDETMILDSVRRIAIAHGFVSGVEYLHSQRIFHRDIKSANVLLDENCEAKICDAGLARDLSMPGSRARGGTHSSVALGAGTAGYIAPEIREMQVSDYSELTDIFAVGVVLAELLSGQLPHDNSVRPVHLADRFLEAATIRNIIDSMADDVWRESHVDYQARVLASQALACVDRDPVRRRDASHVRSALADAIASPARPERCCSFCMEDYHELAQRQVQQAMLLPCRHAALCAGCAALSSEGVGQPFSCPLCRTPVETYVPGRFPYTYVPV